MKTRNILALLLGLGLLLVTFVHSAAQGRADPQSPPRAATTGMLITYQGRLTDKNGLPLNKAVNVVFKLYDSSGVLQWTSAVRSITPVNGLFTVTLGEIPDPPISTAYYKSIGVTVGGDPEMTPRQPFNSLVAYSQDGVGVYGSSLNDIGVMGMSLSYVGVYGGSSDGIGVYGGSNKGQGLFGVSVNNTGVLGLSEGNVGVTGSSTSNTGVKGTSVSGVGVSGLSTNEVGVQGGSDTYIGILAHNQSSSEPALLAENVNGGPAISISGGIRVSSTGVDTTTPVFMHKVDTNTTSGNLCSGSDYATVISNSMTNGKPNAILIVTPNYRASDGSQSNFSGPAKDIPAVFYSIGGRCGTANNNKWVIYNLNTTPMVNNTYYNVMVIWP